jgi:glucose-1-phosphate cytidylyltransferase
MDLPVVILCGGKGTRVGKITQDIPKPLLKVGQRPILWHIMKIYASQGYKHFILCLGYKGGKIKKYFQKSADRDWRIEYVATGLKQSKSERIAKIKPLIKGGHFFLAYGDDVSDIDLGRLLKFHLNSNSVATITAVRMFSIFGVVEIGQNGRVLEFKEKPFLKKWMNGGFMVADRKIFDFLKLGELEEEVFAHLAKIGQLSAYKHFGQWKNMNTLKDNLELNTIWREGKAFWKAW